MDPRGNKGTKQTVWKTLFEAGTMSGLVWTRSPTGITKVLQALLLLSDLPPLLSFHFNVIIVEAVCFQYHYWSLETLV